MAGKKRTKHFLREHIKHRLIILQRTAQTYAGTPAVNSVSYHTGLEVTLLLYLGEGGQSALLLGKKVDDGLPLFLDHFNFFWTRAWGTAECGAHEDGRVPMEWGEGDGWRGVGM